MAIFRSERRFEVWRWGVGHSGLLLRSNPSEGYSTRIEILFKPAYAVCLPSLIEGLSVLVADEAARGAWEAGSHIHSSRLERDQTLFEIQCSAGSGWVLGGSANGREDDDGYDGPTMFDGWARRSGVRELFTTYRE